MQLSQLRTPSGARHVRKRVGRGEGSGHGKTCGRGQKGQNSRSGRAKTIPGFEGGQMPLHRRSPKFGFRNRFARAVTEVSVGRLGKLFQAGDVVDAVSLRAKGALKRSSDEVKILGDGDLSVSLTVRVPRVSKSAREKIEKASGKVELTEAAVEDGSKNVRAKQKKPKTRKS